MSLSIKWGGSQCWTSSPKGDQRAHLISGRPFQSIQFSRVSWRYAIASQCFLLTSALKNNLACSLRTRGGNLTFNSDDVSPLSLTNKRKLSYVATETLKKQRDAMNYESSVALTQTFWKSNGEMYFPQLALRSGYDCVLLARLAETAALR